MAVGLRVAVCIAERAELDFFVTLKNLRMVDIRSFQRFLIWIVMRHTYPSRSGQRWQRR